MPASTSPPGPSALCSSIAFIFGNPSLLLPLPATWAGFFRGRALRSHVAQPRVLRGLHMISSRSLPRRLISYFTNLTSYCLTRRLPPRPRGMLTQHLGKKNKKKKKKHQAKLRKILQRARSKVTASPCMSLMLFKAPPDWGQLGFVQ